ncbi:MAG: ATP-binding cassette domain-containing protein [Gammaproteobacteria bacterium]|nr:ATP-binding cassette domain-containing protein [Gammaproteobacteria bacterium]
MSFELQAERGEILSLIGPSGSGKTSLLNLIAGFIQASAGQIFVDGEDIQQLPPAQRPVSMVFQSHNLFPHLDVFTNIALGINPSLKLSVDEHQSIEDALVTLGLEGFKKRKPGQLSGGQQQRVAIARALVREHDILLLDEPFAALGPAMRAELIMALKELVSRRKMIALMVSHQPADALLASKHTAFIDNGQVISIQKTSELLNDRKRQEIMSYLGSE